MSTCALDVISPITSTRPVVAAHSHATREYGSTARCASSTLSLRISQTLSGCPSVTDSDVKSFFIKNEPPFHIVCPSKRSCSAVCAHFAFWQNKTPREKRDEDSIAHLSANAAGIGTLRARRLPGFTGPVPQPLLIRHIFLCCGYDSISAHFCQAP